MRNRRVNKHWHQWPTQELESFYRNYPLHNHISNDTITLHPYKMGSNPNTRCPLPSLSASLNIHPVRLLAKMVEYQSMIEDWANMELERDRRLTTKKQLHEQKLARITKSRCVSVDSGGAYVFHFQLWNLEKVADVLRVIGELR